MDVKTSSGVSFYVQRNTDYSSAGTVIPYEVTQLNIGGAMNLGTGVFTAPVNGRFHFSFTALSFTTAENTWVFLRVNGVNIGTSLSRSIDYSIPLVATLKLKKGDTVDVYLESGSIHDDIHYHTHFSGFLLEEDLVL